MCPSVVPLRQASPDDRIALMIGNGACLFIGGDALQDLQNLLSVATLTEQGEGKGLRHGEKG